MSYTGDILVTFETIAQAQADVNSTVAQINSQSDDLKSYLAPLVASWEGQASTNYQQLQQQWNNALADLNQVLAEIGQQLGAAHDNYTATENANAGMWS